MYTHPQVAVYGASPDRGLFVVAITGLSASARSMAERLPRLDYAEDF